MGLDHAAADRLSDIAQAFARTGSESRLAKPYLDSSLRLLMKWRSQALADRLLARHGRRVLGGPFAGMEYVSRPSEGSLAARLLGTYEAELHPVLHALAARGVDRVLDVGCAEGYYAVGLARLLPQARVEAYDVDPVARVACAELARINGVGDRVSVRERFELDAVGEPAPRTLVFMDVEGAEATILSDAAPVILRRADLVVETHPGMAVGVTKTLQARFAATHAVEVIHETAKSAPAEAFGEDLLTLDQFAATWEWRATPTPWLVMRPLESG